MASLREYYETDFSRVTNSAHGVEVGTPDGPIALTPRVHIDDVANAVFVSSFLPASPHTSKVCRALVENIQLILEEKNKLQMLSHFDGEDPEDWLDSMTLQFAGRVFFYCEAMPDVNDRREIRQYAKLRGIHVIFRGSAYASARAKAERPLAFISHDTRDKDLIARPIAVGLIKRACPVWFDEYSLKVGDRLRESIEHGLKECKKCILVISPNFLSNSGWSRAEFNSVFTREIIERDDVILPVWLEVTAKKVYEYSPTLADRFALDWKSGEEAVVSKLQREILRTEEK